MLFSCSVLYRATVSGPLFGQFLRMRSRKSVSKILHRPRPRGARLAREGLVVRGETGDQPDQESRSAGTEPQVDFLLDGVGYGTVCTGGNDEREEVQGVHSRGTGRDEGARQRAEGGSAEGGRGTRRAREDRRDGGTGPRHGRAAPRDRQGERSLPLAEDLVRDARLRRQGWQGRLLLPERPEVQHEVRDVGLQRQGEPRRRLHVADLLRAEGAERRRGGEDRRARGEGGGLSRGDADADREGGPT